MDWQQTMTVIAVLIAGAIVVRAALRPLFAKGRGGCGSGCGKCAAPQTELQPGRIRLPQV